MADKNFARSGTGDTGLLADDDPLSELARLVGHEPRPVQPVGSHPFTGAAETALPKNPVLALEDELLRAFDLYDAPQQPAAEPVAPIEPEPRRFEPLFEQAPQFEPAPAFEAAPDYADIPVEEPAARFDAAPVQDVYLAPAIEPAFEPQYEEPAPAVDVDLLADEVEASLYEAPAVDVGVAHQDEQVFARAEPQFDMPAAYDAPVAYHAPVDEPALTAPVEPAPVYEPEPVFLGLQPVTGDDAGGDFDLDLDRELELSIGDSLHQAVFAEQLEPTPVVEPVFVAAVQADVRAEPIADLWQSHDAMAAQPFAAEPAYTDAEPHLVAELPFEAPEVHARAMADAEARWQDADDAGDPVFHAEQTYDVASVHMDHADDLLAEVERFPVPEARSSLAGVTSAETIAVAAAVAAMPQTTPTAPSFRSRATPVLNREMPRTEPQMYQPAPPVPPAPLPEPEIEFDNFELDLSDIDLDLDPAEFALPQTPARVEPAPVLPVRQEPVSVRPEPVAVRREPAVSVRQEPVAVPRHEPAVAVPVTTYMAQPRHADANDGELPFDPSMIAETDSSVSPVAELNVPQLPVIEKEEPAPQHSDYDFDIDAEMAQLFAAPETRAPAAEPEPSSNGQATAIIAEVDDFERALEEDFRRSMNQPERTAIPVDAGQAGTHYAGDGYSEEQPRSRRGMVLAASVAVVAVLAAGGVYALLSGGDGVGDSGEPRVILADKNPVKMVPEEKGGKTVPNQDKAVYDRVAGNSDAATQQDQLVTTTEEPVDVVQRTLTPEALPDDGDSFATDEDGRLLPGVDEPETAAAKAAAEDERSPLVSPRKVRTMIVKPDGTLVAREETVPAPSVAETAPAAMNEPLRGEQADTTLQPRSALADAADADAPVRVVTTTPIGETETASSGDNAPVPSTRPVDQPVNVVGTVTQRGTVAQPETATASPTEVAAVSPGGYVIQIASLPSEADAQKSYNALSAKFASVIGGRGVDIRKAEIANKGTYYRVRIPAGSREEANALCASYTKAGGSCLVTR